MKKSTTQKQINQQTKTIPPTKLTSSRLHACRTRKALLHVCSMLTTPLTHVIAWMSMSGRVTAIMRPCVQSTLMSTSRMTACRCPDTILDFRSTFIRLAAVGVLRTTGCGRKIQCNTGMFYMNKCWYISRGP